MKDLKPDEGKEKQDTNLLTQDLAVVSLKDNNNNNKKNCCGILQKTESEFALEPDNAPLRDHHRIRYLVCVWYALDLWDYLVYSLHQT